MKFSNALLPRTGRCAVVLVILTLTAVPALAVDAGGEDEPPGVRVTPGMARAIARTYTRQVVVSRYGLDESKIDEVSDKVARRLMKTAHELDGSAQDLIEYIMTQNLREGDGSRGPGYLADGGREFARRMKPLIPAIKTLLRDMAADIRPELDPKQQLKFSADMIAIDTAIGALEQNMDRWERGEGKPGENPFEPGGRATPQVKIDADGESAQLKIARRRAQSALDGGEWKQWETYVRQAKELYGFDAAQTATAESLLREYLDRVGMITRDEAWRTRVYRNRLYRDLVVRMLGPSGRMNVEVLEEEYERLMRPVRELGIEFKSRIDQIPTAAQREAAEQRISEAYRTLGFITAKELQP